MSALAKNTCAASPTYVSMRLLVVCCSNLSRFLPPTLRTLLSFFVFAVTSPHKANSKLSRSVASRASHVDAERGKIDRSRRDDNLIDISGASSSKCSSRRNREVPYKGTRYDHGNKKEFQIARFRIICGGRIIRNDCITRRLRCPQ
jgi:hypothetical protein